MFKKRKNKIALTYAFDNENQVNLMFRSILSVYNFEKNYSIDLIISVSSDLYKKWNLIISEFIKNNFDDLLNFKIIEFNFNPGVIKNHGMFYWFYVPFLTKYDFYLIIDNDTIVENFDIDIWVKNYKKILSKNTVLGMENKREIEKKEVQNYLHIFPEAKKNIENYLNTGIIFLSGRNFRKALKSKNEVKKKITEIIEVMWECYNEKRDGLTYSFPENDQLVLLILLGNTVSPILPRRINRNSIPPFEQNEINNELQRENIFHFAYWIKKNDGRMSKIDIDYFFMIDKKDEETFFIENFVNYEKNKWKYEHIIYLKRKYEKLWKLNNEFFVKRTK